MARRLTLEEVEKLASTTGVRRIAVENFLISMPLDIGFYANKQNLWQDARLYQWNMKTVTVIEKGIKLAFSEDK